MNTVEILAEVAKPGFSFRRSLTAVKLGNMQKECIAKGLRMDPARRSTMSEFFYLLPVTVTMPQNPTTSELAGFMKEVQEIKRRLKAIYEDVTCQNVKLNEIMELQIASLDKLLESKDVLLRGIYDGTKLLCRHPLLFCLPSWPTKRRFSRLKKMSK
ncbi:Aste57867_10209 [Aphanomyces stellatus]|uniref:Aste57867_10209 protein n=1 Tax=Aphanomyces stellatus TaxID=120398 RepID=A0A485KQ96_9STRA|nr:hypothetical protein As57867_010170 [Aphanomyces stellatus]VFT87085.1 Aste57867_10209 [Aphanomyces stellatus]